MTLGDLHEGGAWVVVLANGAVGLWALAAHRYAALRRSVLWWAVAAATDDCAGEQGAEEEVEE